MSCASLGAHLLRVLVALCRLIGKGIADIMAEEADEPHLQLHVHLDLANPHQNPLARWHIHPAAQYFQYQIWAPITVGEELSIVKKWMRDRFARHNLPLKRNLHFEMRSDDRSSHVPESVDVYTLLKWWGDCQPRREINVKFGPPEKKQKKSIPFVDVWLVEHGREVPEDCINEGRHLSKDEDDDADVRHSLEEWSDLSRLRSDLLKVQ